MAPVSAAVTSIASDDEPRDILAAGNTTVRTGGRYALHALLRLAHQQIEALALTTPPGDNAYETLQRILAVMPAQPDALRGFRDIADKYEMLATRANQRGKRDLATRYVEKGLALVPGHSDLLALQQKLAARPASQSEAQRAPNDVGSRPARPAGSSK